MTVLREEDLDRGALAALQETRLRALLSHIVPGNPFYVRKFADASKL